MPDFSMDITVNYKNGQERDIEAVGACELKDIGSLIQFSLDANEIKDGSWSSLAIAIVDTTKREPKLKLVS